MSVHQIMYAYQHKILPRNFYEFKQDFVALLLNRSEVLYRVLDDIFSEEGIENPYKEEEFKVKPMEINEKYLSVKLEFPVPAKEPLCYESYIFVDKDLQNLSYFCVECGSEPDIAFICSWTEKGQHLNYSNCIYDEQECYNKCLNIYNKE